MIHSVKINIFLLLILFIDGSTIAQNFYGPVHPNFRRWLVRSDNGNVQDKGLSPSNTLFTVGKDNNVKYRAVYQWDISDNEIPDNSIITNVRIYFSYSPIGHTYQFPASFYNSTYNILNPDQTQLNGMWDNMNTTANEIGTLIGVNSILDFNSNNSSAAITQAVRNALPNDKFILGVRWEELPYIDTRTWHISNLSLTLSIEYIPPQQLVILDQRLSNNLQVGKVRKWEGTNFTPYPFINPGTQFSFPVSSVQTILSDQTIFSNEKYNNWNNDKSNILNHKPFVITSSTNALTANFNAIYSDIAIKNQIEQTTANGGSVEFKDPWLIDYDDPVYGGSVRNRGMDAPFKSRLSPFYPDFSTIYNGDVYQGVFLEQGADWQPPYYSVKALQLQDIYLSNTGKTHKFHFQYWDYDPLKAVLQYPSALETGVVFKESDAAVSAILKGTELTNSSSAYSNSGQRHLARQYNTGNNYNVYESMGYIWLEKSTDNGSTWTLANNAAPLSAGIAKSPSLDFCNGHLLIVYQEKTGTGNLRVKLKLYDMNTDAVIDSAVVIENEYLDFSFDTQPVIADFSGGRFVVIYRNNMEHDPGEYSGLYYDAGRVTSTSQPIVYYVEDIDYGNDDLISGTTIKSVNPAVSTKPSGDPTNIHLVWQQGLESESISHILYQKIQWNGTGFTFPAQVNVSNGCGYTKNYKPSITSITSDDIPRVAWIGYLYDAQGEMGKMGSTSGTQTQTIYRETVFRALDNPSSWSYGSNVVHANINRLEGTPGYAIAWAQENGSGYQNKLMRNTNFYSEYTLNTTGSAIELNNAGLFSNMFGYALHTGSAPYYFGKSQFVNTLQKEQLNNMTAARSGVLYSGNAQFMFSFGDISVNNAPVFFPVIPDTMRLTGLEELKQYLVSDPFMLENQSGFMYSVQYRAVDTGSCSAVLGAAGEVNFRLVLEDSNSGEVLGEYDNITFTQNDLTKYDNISYEVNTAGIGSRLVRLRLIPFTTAELTPSLITRVRSAEEQAKGSLKRIHYNGAEPIKDYSLTQNYPNPFNPVTMIEFALPEQSDITLKVYDILGKEVATLATGSYSAGRYTVPFDGTNHASGVYIYKLSYGKGQSITRKMTLLK
ncbi:MAG: hypothetical protein FMNOHCHN_01423 [Ignavibacteriaceae bacterium]|nr:hypothetical protein [Ignavibacteriaceae bacterium]